MDQNSNYLKIWGLPEGITEHDVLQKIKVIGKVIKNKQLNNVWYIVFEDEVDNDSVEFLQSSYPQLQYIIGTEMTPQDIQKFASIFPKIDDEEVQRKKLEQEKLQEIAKKQQEDQRQKMLQQQQEFLKQQQEEQRKKQIKEKEEALKREEELKQKLLSEAKQQMDYQQRFQQQKEQEDRQQIQQQQEQVQYQLEEQKRLELLRIQQSQSNSQLYNQQTLDLQKEKIKEELALDFAKSQFQQKQLAEQKDQEFNQKIQNLKNKLTETEYQLQQLKDKYNNQQDNLQKQQKEIYDLQTSLNHVTQQRDNIIAKFKEQQSNQGSSNITQEDVAFLEQQQQQQEPSSIQNMLFKFEFWVFLIGVWILSQQGDSLFFQSQLYVAELSDPLTILQFLGNDEFESQKQSSHEDKLEISNKSEQKVNSNKILRETKKNPYGSSWANKVLEKQFGVHLQQIAQRTGPKWIIKKLKPVETNDQKEFEHLRLVKDFRSQEKKIRQTASKSYRKRIDKNFKDQKQSFNGIPIYDPNFQIKLQQYNL
ncbi:unnamed protein product [Paramecium pentaurelia]|uniref:Uncharacterized protein n=1 Tax=Paramecium pentaurelia TaxID=43138 RepID=A0A8S1UK74_9CILI|nr:unnamed protein product [Paramecium pentaurelia]